MSYQSASCTLADLGATEPHDSSALGGLGCPTASPTRASHARRPCLRARPVPEVGRFSPFLLFLLVFCRFLRFFGFWAISRALDAISRKTWRNRHQKAPDCLIGYPKSFTFVLSSIILILLQLHSSDALLRVKGVNVYSGPGYSERRPMRHGRCRARSSGTASGARLGLH